MVHIKLLFNNFNIVFKSDLDQVRNLHMGSSWNCYMLFPASFKLALMWCSCMHNLLPCVASCSFFIHHDWLSIMPCLCVVFLLCCLLLSGCASSRYFLFRCESWGFVRLRLVRLRPFVFFMDSFFFLAGFQARWPLPWISLLSLLC